MSATLPLVKDLIDLILYSSQQEIKEVYDLLRIELGPDVWIPVLYRNSSTGKFYKPHHREEAEFVFDDNGWTNGLLKGGEGSGKSVAGIVKDLERVRRAMNGMLASPDLQHFKKSLWPEFKRWCPWQHVIDEQQRRGQASWEPQEPFTLTFKSGGQLLCGGMDEPEKWDGANVSFAHLDEARRKKDASALKVMAGRIRIPGPDGEQPQMWFTTTPRKHWLFEYFGEWDNPNQPDPRADFKAKAHVLTLKTQDNEDAGNLAPGYTKDRAASLTEAERRVLLEAGWEDIDDVERFLSSITLWDALIDPALPPLDIHQPLVLAVDAGVTNDNFALVGGSRHPDPNRSQDEVVVRLSRVWKPNGSALDFDAIQAEIVQICQQFNVVMLVYDKYQLHQMMTTLKKNGVVVTREFSQQGDRAVADKGLHDSIVTRHIWHDGTHADLRQHLDNADRKIAGDDRQIRIVKREDALKVDLAVACSMMNATCRKLNLW